MILKPFEILLCTLRPSTLWTVNYYVKYVAISVYHRLFASAEAFENFVRNLTLGKSSLPQFSLIIAFEKTGYTGCDQCEPLDVAFIVQAPPKKLFAF